VLLDARHIISPFFILVHAFRFGIHEAVHGILAACCTAVAVFIFRCITPHACSAASASPLALVVTG
jgi:hypothetical protein